MKTISIIGVGGAGCHILEQLSGTLPSSFRLIGIDTITYAPEYRRGIQDITIGLETYPKPFCGLPPEWGRRAADEDKQKIIETIAGSDMVCAIACLGGGTGSGALPVVIELCKASGILTIAVATHPFCFEGRKRTATALDGFSEVESLADFTRWIPYDCLRAMLSPKTTLKDVYRFADEVIGCSVKEITSFFHNDKKWMPDVGGAKG